MISLRDRQPEEIFQSKSDVFTFSHTSSTILNILKLVDTFSGENREQRITIIQAAENKARNKLNNCLLAWKLSDSRYLSDVEVASPTHSDDLLFPGQGRVKGDIKALHLRCKGNPTS